MDETLKELLAQTWPITQAQLTPAVIEKIKVGLQSQTETEQETTLRNLLQKAWADAQDEINALKTSIETPEVAGYSLSHLAETIESKNAQTLVKVFDTVIVSDLETLLWEQIKDINPVWQETIKIVLWSQVQSKMTLSGIISSSVWGITDIAWSLWSVFWESNEQTSSSQLDSLIQAKVDVLKQTPGITETQVQDIEKSIKIISGILWKEVQVLARIFEVTSELKPEEKNMIFEDPLVLQALMKDGKYSEQWFGINLETWEVKIWTLENTPANQAAFMQEVAKSSSGLWNKVEKLKKIGDSFPFLKDFFMQFSDTPVIGIFIKAIFGGMFDSMNGMIDVVDFQGKLQNITDRAQRLSLEKLTWFFNSYAHDETIWDSPLKKLASQGLSSNFIEQTSPFFDTLKTQDIDPTGKDFWKNILTGTVEKWSYEEQIFNKLKGTVESSSLDEAWFIEQLNSVTITALTATAPAIAPTKDSATDSEILTGETTEATPVKISTANADDSRR